MKKSNFIKNIIAEDIRNNKNGGWVITRFPPEPNGYLHIGHVKSMALNFGLAEEFEKAVCHLRFDDTNPEKESVEYTEAIKNDLRWLGFDWRDKLFYASDYFERLYGYAKDLIKKGKAYVCELSPDEVRGYRGTLTEPGKESPFRNREARENLDLFERMKNGEFEEGSLTLRAKIDMASPNMNMRDPAIYRIKRVSHHKTGDSWFIYPMYDFAHSLSDSIEGITHSLCTLEFEDHRPLYDWFLDQLETKCHPRQIEFARLNITYTVLSKRKLALLVGEKVVSGWDDPRMPTISGLRRRGYTPLAIKKFCDSVGVAKSNSIVDIAQMEFFIREDLNQRARRAMVVLDPLKVVISNYPEGQVEELEAPINPEDPGCGKRKLPFSRVVYIERDDFRLEPPKKYRRLAPGKEVRLVNAYYIKCTDVIKDDLTGEIKEVLCTYDPQTKGGWSEDGRKVKGSIHWVSKDHALDGELRLYNHLFTEANPDDEDGKDFHELVNPDSVEIISNCKLEPNLAAAEAGEHFQFLRKGYFCLDPDSESESEGKLIFNRTASLRDTWAKIEKSLPNG